jgi:hypothetical protein
MISLNAYIIDVQIECMFGSAAVSLDFSVIEFNGIDFDEK